MDGILVAISIRATLHAREVCQRVVGAFPDKVFHTTINRTVKFPDASVAAEPIISFASSTKGADSYRQLARELIARGAAA